MSRHLRSTTAANKRKPSVGNPLSLTHKKNSQNVNRTSEGLYRLPGEETLPKYEPHPLSHTPTAQLPSKNLIDGIIQEIIQSWPTMDVELCQDSNRQFISLVFDYMPGGFAKKFMDYLETSIHRFRNSKEDEKVDALTAVKAKIEAGEPIVRQIYDKFSRAVEVVVSGGGNCILAACSKKGKKFQIQIDTARKMGKHCQKRAIWIGIEENPKIPPGHMVETQEQAQMLDESTNVSDFCQRICAPPSGKLWPLIFWTKNDANDSSPTPDKIFGAAVYQTELLVEQFRCSTNPFDMGAAELSQLYMRYKSPVIRDRFMAAGKMVKATGMQAVNHILYKAEIKEGKQRPELENIMPVSEAIHHEFYNAFLPHWAAEHTAVAQEQGKLMNPLGYPSGSTFATFGYSAGLHLDTDDTPTRGWVTQRPQNLPRHCSNFVWGSHRLILEMQENMFWYWDARKHHHGTTLSNLSIDCIITGSKTQAQRIDAQWTQVSVFPKAVADAR